MLHNQYDISNTRNCSFLHHHHHYYYYFNLVLVPSEKSDVCCLSNLKSVNDLHFPKALKTWSLNLKQFRPVKLFSPKR